MSICYWLNLVLVLKENVLSIFQPFVIFIIEGNLKYEPWTVLNQGFWASRIRILQSSAKIVRKTLILLLRIRIPLVIWCGSGFCLSLWCGSGSYLSLLKRNFILIFIMRKKLEKLCLPLPLLSRVHNIAPHCNLSPADAFGWTPSSHAAYMYSKKI